MRQLLRFLGRSAALARCNRATIGCLIVKNGCTTSTIATTSVQAKVAGRLLNNHKYKRANVLGGSVQRRHGHGQPLTQKTVRDRIILVCQLFDKIDPEKLKLESHFIKDMGLDSLDHVEVIMAIEDDFEFEIPDGDAERLLTPGDIYQYICDRNDVYE